MGVCWSNQIKAAGTPSTTRVNPRYVSRHGGNELSSTSRKVSSASVPPTPRRRRGEILQSSTLKNYSYSELKIATSNFRPDNVLGEGGFGTVFRGWIDEKTLEPSKAHAGVMVAVKKLKPDSLQGHREWLAEINYLGQLSHPNLVKLIGFCLEDEHRLLVYEFMSRGSLEDRLFRRGTYFPSLSWSLRMKVAVDAARGLGFLHSAEPKIIYRDFKTSNILLDISYKAKLSDFGLARDGPTDDKSHVSTRVVGTYGYAAPEYLATGHLSPKSDVYSFGVVLLEILSGKRAIDKHRPKGQEDLVEWAKPYLTNKRRIFRVMDVRLEGQYTLEQARKVASLALMCIDNEPKVRPSMDQIIATLEQLQGSRKGQKDRRSSSHGNRGSSMRMCRGSGVDVPKMGPASTFPRPSASPLYAM